MTKEAKRAATEGPWFCEGVGTSPGCGVISYAAHVGPGRYVCGHPHHGQTVRPVVAPPVASSVEEGEDAGAFWFRVELANGKLVLMSVPKREAK